MSAVQRLHHARQRYACGSTFEGTCDHLPTLEGLLAIWQMCHSEAPHRPVRAWEAAEVRRRQERALRRDAVEVRP